MLSSPKVYDSPVRKGDQSWTGMNCMRSAGPASAQGTPGQVPGMKDLVQTDGQGPSRQLCGRKRKDIASFDASWKALARIFASGRVTGWRTSCWRHKVQEGQRSLEHRHGQVEEAFLTQLPLLSVAGSHLPTSGMPCATTQLPASVPRRDVQGCLGKSRISPAVRHSDIRPLRVDRSSCAPPDP